MKNPKPVIATFIVLLIVNSALGQAANTEGQRQKLRTNIQRVLAGTPPHGEPDPSGFRPALQILRNELRDLLIERRGELKNQIQTLGAPDAHPAALAVVENLKVELQSVNTEIDAITKVLGQAVGLVPLPVTPPVQLPAPEPPPQNPPPEGFEEKVKLLAASDLTDEAAPPEVAESEAVVGCDGRGQPAVKLKEPFSIFDANICTLAFELNENKREVLLEQDLNAVFTIVAAKLLKTKTSEGESYASFVTEAQESRIEQQIGAEPTSSSATSLVSKGGIPYLFGFAVENGAAEQSQKDTTITFRINPGGLFNLFADKGFVTGFQGNEDDPFLKFLKKTSLGLSFDTSRGEMPGVFTGQRQQLSQVSARIEFVNERDPRHKKYEAEWETFVADQGVKLADDVWNVIAATVDFGTSKEDNKAFRDPVLQAWLIQMNDSIAKAEKIPGDVARINALAQIIRDHADLMPVEGISEQTIEALTLFAKRDEEYLRTKDELLDKIAKGKIFTLDYINTREVNAPDTSSFNFIAGTGTGRRINLTANGSFTFFHTRPAALSLTSPRPGRFRDFQFAGQVDIPFKVGGAQFDFWFSGRYERLLEDASALGGTIIPGTKGNIGFGQFGLNIPIPALGIKFPVSFTFANRTEFIKEKEVRGNFGFTFNWDTLFSKLKPF